MFATLVPRSRNGVARERLMRNDRRPDVDAAVARPRVHKLSLPDGWFGTTDDYRHFHPSPS